MLTAARLPRPGRGPLLVWSAAILFLLPGVTTFAEALLARQAPSDLATWQALASIALAVGLVRRARLARWIGALSAAVMLWVVTPAFLQAVVAPASTDDRIAGVIGLAGNLWILYVLMVSPSVLLEFRARRRSRAQSSSAALPTPDDSATV